MGRGAYRSTSYPLKRNPYFTWKRLRKRNVVVLKPLLLLNLLFVFVFCSVATTAAFLPHLDGHIRICKTPGVGDQALDGPPVLVPEWGGAQ